MPENRRSTANDEHFQKVLAAILLAEEDGKKPDLSHICRAHPQLAERLRQYFRDRDGFDRVAPHIAPRPRGADAPAVPELAPGDWFGGYDVIKELGRGGMGVVYLARQRSTKRQVALKVIRADRLAHLTPRQRREWLTRFRTEGRAAARVTDDRVVPVYEVGDVEGRPFYSMRYVVGQNLATMVEAGPMPNKRAALLMEQVARAVQAIHDEGVVHRDLKPHNILVDAKGRPYVSDFGLAKSLVDAETLTETGDLLGSPEYMSPEQAHDAARVGPATDVYGLGATLYALLTGRPPFQGTTVVQTLYDVKHRDPVPPRRLNLKAARDLETLALKCLEKESGRRLRSAAELADELQRYLEKRPIHTRPLGPTGRVWRWCRRSPVLAGLSAAVAVLAVVAGTLGVVHQVNTVERDKAEKLARDEEQKRLDQEAIARTERQERLKKEREAEIAQQAADEEKRKRMEQETQTTNAITQGEQHKQDARQARAQTAVLSYFEGMREVDRLLEAGDVGHARQLLRQYLPARSEPDVRGWEWHFLSARCRDLGFMARQHAGRVQALAWNPDSTRLASGDTQGQVKVWDVAAGAAVRELRLGMERTGGVMALAWSADGKLLAGADMRTLCVWDATSGALLKDLPRAKDVNPGLAMPARVGETPVSRHIFIGSWTLSLMWSPRGHGLALSDADGKLQSWDVDTGKQTRWWSAHEDGVHSAAWSPDGRRLASVGGDGLAKVWDAATGKEDWQALVRTDRTTPTVFGLAVAWADDGKHVNVVSGDGELRVLEARTGNPVATRALHPRDPLSEGGPPFNGGGRLGSPSARFVWSPDGRWLASIQIGGDVRVWDPATGKETDATATPGTSVPFTSTECAPAWDTSGRWLGLGGGDGTVQAWPVGVKRHAVRRLPEQLQAWGARGRYLLGTHNTQLEQREYLKQASRQALETAKALQGLTRGGMGGLVPPPRGGLLRGGGLVGPAKPKPRPMVEVRRPLTGELVRALGKGTWPPDVLADDPRGRWLAAATRDGVVQLHSWSTSGLVRTLKFKPTPRPGAPGGPGSTGGTALAWSPHGRWLACATPQDWKIRLWDPAAPRKPAHVLEGHKAPVVALAWSPDGKHLASADVEGAGIIWEPGRAAHRDFTFYVQRSGVNAGMAKPLAASMLCWSPDGKHLAVAGEDQRVVIRDPTTDDVRPLSGPTSNNELADIVCAVAWSPDGKRLVAAGPEGTFVAWDTATWQIALILHQPSPGAFNQRRTMPGQGGTLAWNPDNRQLAFFGGGKVIIWDATPEHDR
jgi:WD40 repeat protein/serine/threonine protein kinase